MRFKEFVQITEAGTSTGDIAGFSRITLPLVTRQWPPELGGEWPESDKKDRKKKKVKQPQVQD